MSFEYLELSELRKLLDEKKVSSVDLTKYFLNRINELDPKLNSFITVAEEEALLAAQEADEYIASDGENFPLTGIYFC